MALTLFEPILIGLRPVSLSIVGQLKRGWVVVVLRQTRVGGGFNEHRRSRHRRRTLKGVDGGELKSGAGN